MDSVQSIFPENPVQPIRTSSASKSANPFQKILQTKSNSAEIDSEDISDSQLDEIMQDTTQLDLAEEEIPLQQENLIPMAFIPVLEQVQPNAFEQNEQPELINQVYDLNKDFSASADKIVDLSVLSDMADKVDDLSEKNIAAETLVAVLPPVDNSKIKPYVSSAGKVAVPVVEEQNLLLAEEAKVTLQAENLAINAEEITIKQTELKNDNLNQVKNDSMMQNSAAVSLPSDVKEAVTVNDTGKNIASGRNKLSDKNLQLKDNLAQSADKTTDSKSFWQNVSSRLTVRKENSEQPSGNMNGQQFFAESNLSDVALNSKNITSVNEKLNQIFDFAEQDNVLDQVVKRVEIDLKPGQTEMRMQLKPENLGEVQMKVVVEDGKLNAHFLTSTATAKEALEANVQQLKQSLQEQGVKVEKIAVLLSSGDLQFNQKQQDESLYQNQKISKNWRKSGIADYENADETMVSRVIESNQILSAEQVDYRA